MNWYQNHRSTNFFLRNDASKPRTRVDWYFLPIHTLWLYATIFRFYTLISAEEPCEWRRNLRMVLQAWCHCNSQISNKNENESKLWTNLQLYSFNQFWSYRSRQIYILKQIVLLLLLSKILQRYEFSLSIRSFYSICLPYKTIK